MQRKLAKTKSGATAESGLLLRKKLIPKSAMEAKAADLTTCK